MTDNRFENRAQQGRFFASIDDKRILTFSEDPESMDIVRRNFPNYEPEKILDLMTADMDQAVSWIDARLPELSRVFYRYETMQDGRPVITDTDGRIGCTVFFCTKDEMRQYEREDFGRIEILQEKIRDCGRKLTELEERILSSIPESVETEKLRELFGRIHETLGRLDAFMKDSYESYPKPGRFYNALTELEEERDELAALLRRRLHVPDPAGSEMKKILRRVLKDLDSLLKELKLFTPRVICLGRYYPAERIILLCPENIQSLPECQDDHDLLPFTSSVLLHEFTHHLHAVYVRKYGKSGERRGRRGSGASFKEMQTTAVKETIAEAMQFAMAQTWQGFDGLWHRLTAEKILFFLERQAKEGPFPAWGYHGGLYVRDFSDTCELKTESLIDRITELSGENWDRAYNAILALADLGGLQRRTCTDVPAEDHVYEDPDMDPDVWRRRHAGKDVDWDNIPELPFQ